MNPNHCHIKTHNMPIFISFEQVGGGGGGGLVEAKPIDASGKTVATSSYSGDIVNHYTYQGRKLGKKVYNSQHTLTVDEEYYDELMFSFGKPSRISHGDGYIALSDNGGATFYYYLKDHLGNVRSVILPDASNQPVVSQANDYFPFGMSFESTLPNPGIRANYNKLKYNGKEEQEMPGKWLDYGARFYDAQIGRWHGVDPLAEKYYFESPYCYVGNNPLIYLDPDGQEKFKAEAHFKMTTGVVGIGLKALGIKKYFEGAKESQISFNITFDSDSKRLTLGFGTKDKEVEGGAISGGLMYGFSNTTEKEVSHGLNLGFDFKDNKFVFETESNPDSEKPKEKKIEEGTLGIGTITQTDGEANKLSIGLNPEINLFLIGTGLGVNVSVEKDEKN